MQKLEQKSVMAVGEGLKDHLMTQQADVSVQMMNNTVNYTGDILFSNP